MEKLPLYRVKVNPDDKSGVYMVSLVDEPAIEENWIKLSKQVVMEFTADKDKQMLYGPMLIPNKMIYRRDEDSGEEYNIMFEKDTIELISNKFNKNKLTDKFNFQHSEVTVDAYLTENWLTDRPDKSEKYGFKLPEGTWFGAVKVEDKSFWDKYVKGEKVKGFSVEILAGAELISMSNNNKEEQNIKFMEIKTKDGATLYFEGELAQGIVIFLDEAMTELAPKGEHELEDGRIIVLDDESKVLEIKDAIEEVVEEELEIVDEVIEQPTEVQKTIIDRQMVLDIVQPMFDEVFTAHAEIMTKITELESKLDEGNTEEMKTELSSIKEKVELLSKTPGANTIDNKDDKRITKENFILSRINTFGRK